MTDDGLKVFCPRRLFLVFSGIMLSLSEQLWNGHPSVKWDMSERIIQLSIQSNIKATCSLAFVLSCKNCLNYNTTGRSI